MSDSERATKSLRGAIAAIAQDRAPALIEDARAEAESRVRARLVAAFESALLERAAESLHPGGAAPPAAPAPGPATGARTPTPRAATEPAGLGYYVYGVARAGETELPDPFPGVDPDHTATLIDHRGLVAIASRVSLDEFGEEPLHENLNDLKWLEAKARAHEQVLDAVLSQASVVPMRLCTIYHSESHVHEALERDYDVFTDALHRLEGTKEWGVKLIAEPGALDRAVEAAAGDRDLGGTGLSEGAAYMREKGRAARRRGDADRLADGWAQHVHDQVSAHAVEGLLNPLQNPEVSGHEGDMLLNGVYLVEDRCAEAFASAVVELSAEYELLGASVELTGPWPPYNFVKGSIEAAR